MISNGLLTQLRLPQPVLKTLQKRLVLLANRLDPLLIRLGMLRIRHLTLSLCNLPDFSPLVSSLRQDRLAILGFFFCSIRKPFFVFHYQNFCNTGKCKLACIPETNGKVCHHKHVCSIPKRAANDIVLRVDFSDHLEDEQNECRALDHPSPRSCSRRKWDSPGGRCGGGCSFLLS